MTLSFTKMNGAGNDFVMLDNRAGSLALTGGQIAQLCDRHRGVGADGVLVVEPAADGADFRMRYYNADGGEAEMCGNGARCFARFARRVSGNDAESISFETPAGVIGARCVGDDVQIDMGAPHSYATATTLNVDGVDLTVHSINTGVPHAVIFVDDLEATDVHHIGMAIRRHPHFAPKGTNVNFVNVCGPGEVAVRTYERGVEGETLACGTGVVACALIHHLECDAASPVSIVVRGGDTLRVGFERGETPGDFSKVTLTGPADFVFDGTVAL
ncbi:MAG: diaminopimelate epimerase [Chthoniobacterales bacterium]